MDTRHDHDENHYIVDNAGVGLHYGLQCAHGDAAIGAELRGTPCKPDTLPAAIETLIPRCGFAGIVGSVFGQIRHYEGEAAYERFRDQVLLAESTALQDLQQS